MKLSDLTPAQRRELAAKVGTHAMYLWQCATGRRTPSLKLVRKLIEAEPRLTLESFAVEKAKVIPRKRRGKNTSCEASSVATA